MSQFLFFPRDFDFFDLHESPLITLYMNRSSVALYVGIAIVIIAAAVLAVIYFRRYLYSNGVKHTGLVNTNNICYVNTAMQIFYSHEHFRELILSNKLFFHTWILITDMFDNLQKGTERYDCTSLITTNIRSNHLDMFKINQFYDVLDFYKTLVDALIDQLNSHVKSTNNNASIASLNISNSNSERKLDNRQRIAEKIRKMFYIEISDKNGEEHCQNRTLLFNLHKTVNHYSNNIEDIEIDESVEFCQYQVVNYPELLNITINKENIAIPQIYQEITFFGMKYRLESWAEFTTKMKQPHYICYSKRDGSWYKFDDESISHIKGSKIESLLTNNKEGYLLVYNRVE